jgi:hypothetical protein
VKDAPTEKLPSLRESIHLNKGEIQMSENNKAILEAANAAIALRQQ